MSGQPDLLPEAYGKSLKVLQEEVPPQDFETIRGIVEAEVRGRRGRDRPRGGRSDDNFQHKE